MPLALIAPLLAFATTAVVLYFMLRHRIARAIVDHPNERSLHQAPTPRVGGIALMTGLAVAWGAAGGITWPLGVSVAALVGLSLLDDWRGLPVTVRFAAQGLIVAGYLWLGGGVAPPVVALLVAWFAMVWMTNLYNFMDGSDGLAGGMALFGFGAYALAAWLSGDHAFMLLSLCVATAAAGFLVYNFHPAKVFMGDAGSIPLGFLAASLGLAGIAQGLWPAWFPPVVFAPFVVDATVTLIRRLMRGEKIWQAHRTHYYQRLVQMGWGHRGTALAEYALMGLTGLAALWALGQPARMQGAVLAVLALVYSALMVWVDRRWITHVEPRSGDETCD